MLAAIMGGAKFDQALAEALPAPPKAKNDKDKGKKDKGDADKADTASDRPRGTVAARRQGP